MCSARGRLCACACQVGGSHGTRRWYAIFSSIRAVPRRLPVPRCVRRLPVSRQFSVDWCTPNGGVVVRGFERSDKRFTAVQFLPSPLYFRGISSNYSTLVPSLHNDVHTRWRTGWVFLFDLDPFTRKMWCRCLAGRSGCNRALFRVNLKPEAPLSALLLTNNEIGRFLRECEHDQPARRFIDTGHREYSLRRKRIEDPSRWSRESV